MSLAIQAYDSAAALPNPVLSTTRIVSAEFTFSVTDIVEFGGSPLSTEDSFNIITERAFKQLQDVVAQAREALGLPAEGPLDTSAEATAQRILDFALGLFDGYSGNHEELSEEDARTPFVELIRGAILQGIDEARGILGALNALNPEIDTKIDTIQSIIEQGLQAFLENVQ